MGTIQKIEKETARIKSFRDLEETIFRSLEIGHFSHWDRREERHEDRQ
jgi:hypothetical protein